MKLRPEPTTPVPLVFFPAVWRPGLIIFGLMAASSAPAQEALQNMMAGNAAADARSQQMQSPNQDYTFKKGDFRMLLSPTLGATWVDNENLSQTNSTDDYIISPALGITASYPFSQENLLYLNITAGYNEYLQHPDLSSFSLNSSSGTGFSFDFVVKDVTINFHDWMNYSQGVTGANGSSAGSSVSGGNSAYLANSSVANTATFGTFQNTAGLAPTWNLNQITLSAGYDHQNVLGTTGQFNDINHSAELLFGQIGFRIDPRLTLGLESSATFTTYEQTVLNNNQNYSVGVYADYRPDGYFHVSGHVGYTISQYDQTSQSLQTSDLNSWYVDLNVTHAITDAITYGVDVGHSVANGVQSDATETYYVTPNVTWNFRKDWAVLVSGSYNYGQQGVGSQLLPTPTANNNLVAAETFSWFTGTVGLSHAITKRLAFGMDYRITLRSSSSSDRGYTQNEVDLQLTYKL